MLSCSSSFTRLWWSNRSTGLVKYDSDDDEFDEGETDDGFIVNEGVVGWFW